MRFLGRTSYLRIHSEVSWYSRTFPGMTTRKAVSVRKIPDQDGCLSSGIPMMNTCVGNLSLNHASRDTSTPRVGFKSGSQTPSRAKAASRRANSAASSRPKPRMLPPTAPQRHPSPNIRDFGLVNTFESSSEQQTSNTSGLCRSSSAKNDASNDEEQLIFVHGKSPSNIEEFMRLHKQNPIPDTRLRYQRRQSLPSPASDRRSFDEDSSGEEGEVPCFQANNFFSPLHNKTLGHTLLTTPLIESTQTFLKKYYASVPNGTVLVADLQKAGKGRGSNVWVSPPGCLMFSFTCRFSNGELLPFLQYVVALAVVQAVQQQAATAFCTEYRDDLVDVRIKWPNDVYAGGQKIGGVLCESVYDIQKKEFVVIVGCGLNVSNSKPTVSVWDVLKQTDLDRSLKAGVRRPIGMTLTLPPREVILAATMERVEGHLKQLEEHGFSDQLEKLYLNHWLHTNQTVTLMETDASGKKAMEGLIIKGLTKAGMLLAVDSKGQRFELHPDGNSLDFFKGLVRRKLSK